MEFQKPLRLMKLFLKVFIQYLEVRSKIAGQILKDIKSNNKIDLDGD
jgi:hypothetical protein